jgi:hypothetical protein
MSATLRSIPASNDPSFPSAGTVTDSQLFSFSSSLTGNNIKLSLAPKNGDGNLCLVDQGGKLGSETCVASSASRADVSIFYRLDHGIVPYSDVCSYSSSQLLEGELDPEALA